MRGSLLLSLAACLACNAGSLGDAGIDGGNVVLGSGDGGADAGVDGGRDGGSDAGADGGQDAGADAGPDGGSDAGVDAGPDAGELDGGFDAGPCAALSAFVAAPDGGVCVDLYEESVWVALTDGGAAQWPFNQPVDALTSGTYWAEPAAGLDPQGYISAVQGAAACEASGKRLCELTEWLAACQGPQGWIYPYGDTYQPGACNEGRATNPVIDLFGSGATFDFTELNDPRLDQLPTTVALGGAFTACVSSYGIFDMHGNVEEWVSDTTATGHGIFKGGYFVDATINGPGCTYETTAHATDYHDYSTGFRCCSDPTP